jgi:hypothetical protein
MSGEPGDQGRDVLGLSNEEREATLAWVGEHLALVRQSAVGDRVLYWILGIGVVVGLAAHIGGFLLRSSTTGEPLSLVADLLYSLGFALWTGVVVAIFVQIWPDAKKRQYRQALDAYEAAMGRRAQTAPPPHPPSPDDA